MGVQSINQSIINQYNFYSAYRISGPRSEAHKSLACSCVIIEAKAASSTGSRAAEELGCFHRWSMKFANKHIFLYLSAAPQHAVADNSEVFLRLERVMIKTIDLVSTIPTPLTLQEKKIVAVASCHTSL